MKNKARRTRYLMNVMMISVLAVLSVIMIYITFNSAKDNSLENMTTVAGYRSKLIEDYIAKVEEELQLYAESEEVIAAVEAANKLNLSDVGVKSGESEADQQVTARRAEIQKIRAEALKKADKETTHQVSDGDSENVSNIVIKETPVSDCQKYTEAENALIARNNKIEGIYCATLDTIIISHSNSDNVGMQTRIEESRRLQLKTALDQASRENVSKVYNTGFIISPASGNALIMSMYRYVFPRDEENKYDKEPIGIAGMGIYIQDLLDSIDPTKNDETSNNHDENMLDNATYALIDLNKKYTVGPNASGQISLLDAAADDPNAKELFLYVNNGVEALGFSSERLDVNNENAVKPVVYLNNSKELSETFEGFFGQDPTFYSSLGSKKTGNFVFTCNNPILEAKKGQKFVSAYNVMTNRRWVLLVNSPQKDIYSFARQMTLILAAFCVLCLVIILLFNIISRRQEATTAKLIKTNQKNEKIKANLSSAVMKDILTESSTRISFFSDFQNPANAEPGNAMYFFMVTVKHLSEINITYGNDVGDFALLNTAETIRNELPDAKVYRTGSDEFIAYVQKKNINGYESVMDAANKIRNELSRQKNYQGKIFTSSVAIAIIKKSKNVNSSVCLSLKNLLNDSNNDETKVLYLDLDNM